ncbi:Fe-S cluster assembly protein SufD [Candidatus Schneideria nysicola]|uniref:Fe-S cluster assembly protein SufD n=1 Tax=Candidatus Schneideria nysicola TaxID=1081631 RepID=UPI001CAA5504|nr:Fe-S cluster assembly protein SufD [Candidatus Schneideria nysicola]UAJ65932.1 Fe-S cluster assembly protein SufD [Candidatus Schneideria nysicola]
MAGLSMISNNNRVFNQWLQIFRKKNNRSLYAQENWKKLEKIELFSNRNSWEKTVLLEILSKNFISLENITISSEIYDNRRLNLNAYYLVFVNGCLVPSLSDQDIGAWQVKIENTPPYLPLPSPIYSEFFLHLTESLHFETTRIFLPSGKKEEKPLYMVHISEGSIEKDTLNMINYHHIIEIGKGGSGEVIEHFISLNQEKSYFNGNRTLFFLDDETILKHIKLGMENSNSYHFAHHDIHIGNNSTIESNVIMLGTKFSRHQTSVRIHGNYSKISLNSLILLSKNNIGESRTYIEHNKSNCSSRQLHKMIVKKFGKGIFNGLIKVTKGAIKTDGNIINNNLLLDREAEVKTDPQLEIYADDVKCKHGATIGYLNEEQIFYLCTRGILYKQAKTIIIYGFVQELLTLIRHQTIKDMILSRLSSFLSEII